jgi:hypothetical protein
MGWDVDKRHSFLRLWVGVCERERERNIYVRMKFMYVRGGGEETGKKTERKVERWEG